MKIKGIEDHGDHEIVLSEWFNYKRTRSGEWFSLLEGKFFPCNLVASKENEESYKKYKERKDEAEAT
jgi:hypothetical protein